MPQVPLSKSHLNSFNVLTCGGSVVSTGTAGLLPATLAGKRILFYYFVDTELKKLI